MEGLIFDESQPAIPRTAPPKNIHNYTELELVTKEKAIKDASKDYPRLPPKWIEWLYDAVETKPKEEIEKIINEKLWEKQINTTRQSGGVIKDALEILPPPSLSLSDASGN